MRDFNIHEQENRKSLFRKVKWKIPEESAYLEQQKKEYKAKKEDKLQVKVIDGRTFAYNFDIGIRWDEERINSYTFNNKNLKDLEPNGSQAFGKDHWDCTIKYDEDNARLFIEKVCINTEMNGEPHLVPVFRSISFEDIVMAFDIDGIVIEQSLDFIRSSILPSTVREYYGYNGAYNGDEKYQAGLSQFLVYTFYCADTIITLEVEYSFTFMYPDNNFEPTGVIDASKIYPQITFYYRKERNLRNFNVETIPHAKELAVPNGKDGNKIKIKNLYARTKVTCNNNSSHHLHNLDNGYDTDYFGCIRDGGHIPPIFEKHFDSNKLHNNIVGFYTDSNTGRTDSAGNKDDRSRPTFEIRADYTIGTGYFQPAPFWNNIFDYGKYNHSIATEFTAVNNDLNQHRKLTVLHPWNAGPANLTVHKKPRQGAYDNIHLHGYFGNYPIDGQPVIHAPICGYCCFHMHWRWSALNDAIVNSPAIAMGTGNYSRAMQRIFMPETTRIKAYLGWGKSTKLSSQEMPYTTKGAPLIPSDQNLNIAVTPHDFSPETQTAEVVSENSGTSLSETEKTIWYSIKIENEFGAHGAHLSMEQGCGYAFRYSALGKYMPNIRDCAFPESYRKILSDSSNGIPGNFDDTFLDYLYNEQTEKTSLKAAEYYEIQYRFMKFFNQDLNGIDKTNINQVPAVNLGATGADPNNSSNYGTILQAFEDL